MYLNHCKLGALGASISTTPPTYRDGTGQAPRFNCVEPLSVACNKLGNKVDVRLYCNLRIGFRIRAAAV